MLIENDDHKLKKFACRVFTTQLGKKSSLKHIQQCLKDTRHIDTEFCQGNTMRWAVAWTFDDTYHFPENYQSRETLKVVIISLNSFKCTTIIIIIILELEEERTCENPN